MFQPGDRIDIWVVEMALGAGGMGSVYRCRNRSASRILAAVKVLDSAMRRHPEAEARFVREAEILFGLDHPNIVKVRNVRTDEDPPYLEMEFVEGESLEERLRRGALPIDLAVSLMKQCASALVYLHQLGIRHRDIKPANLVIRPEGDVKLVDFGLAVEMDSTRITQQGTTFGTVSYAPPEWIAPDKLDAALWDIYALGVVFHEMLTGTPAFPVSGEGSPRQQAMQVVVGKQNHPPLDPGPSFHDDVRALIRDMTHPSPQHRLASATSVLERADLLLPELRERSGRGLAPPALEPGMIGVSMVTTELPEPPSLANDPALPAVVTPARRNGLLVMAAVLGLGGVGVGVGLGALGIAAIATLGTSADSHTDLWVRVENASADAPISVLLDGAPGTRSPNGWEFSGRPPGRAELTWVAGHPGCEDPACPGDACPVWCASGRRELDLEGDRVEVALPALLPAPRAVALTLPELPDDVEIVATLGGRDGRRTREGVSFADVAPGPRALVVSLGTCPDDARGCWPDGGCPPGCTSYVAELAVPADPTAELGAIVLPPPALAPPRPVPTGAPRRVTHAAFAGWLAKHPEWQPGGELADPDPSYLGGWTGANPPPGAEGTPVVGVSYSAAQRFCEGRGGLLSIEDEPLAWDDQPSMEWRAGRKVLDGLQGSLPGVALAHTGFRCRG